MPQEKITKILEIEVKYKEGVKAMQEYSQAAELARHAMETLEEQKKANLITDEQYHRQMQITKVALTETNDRLRRVAKEMQNNVRQEQYLKGSLTGLRAELSVLTKQYDELSRVERESAKGDELRKKINKVTTEIKDAEKATQRFYRNVGNYPEVMAQAGQAMNGFISTIPGLGGLSSAFSGVSSALGGMMGGIKGAVGGLGIFGAAVTGTIAVVGALGVAFTDGAKTAMTFNSAVSTLAAVSGTDANGVKALTDQARELGATTRYSATEVVQLQTELAKLGYTQGDIKNMTSSVLAFAQATGVELAEAASLTGASLRMFGDDTTHTAEYVDKMAKACTSSALDFHYLETAMSTVGPVANAFGFNIEDVLSLLGQLANAGFDASSAATATRNILLNLADANGDLAKQLGKPVTSLEELTDGLKQLDERGINLSESLALTDKRSVSAFNTFLKAAENTQALKDKLTDADGAAQQMADTMADNLEGDVASLSSAWQELTLKINGTQEPMRSILKWLTQIVRSAGEAYVKLKTSFAELYNESMAFRGILQTIKLVLDVVVDLVKATFGSLGDVVVGFGKALKGAFMLDWDTFTAGMEQFMTATTTNTKKMLKEIWADAKKEFGETIHGKIEMDVETNEDNSTTTSSGGKNGPNKGMNFKNDKQIKSEASEAKARAKAELEIQKEYEESLNALIEDNNAKRKASLEQRIKNEIDKLKLKLETEKDLTAQERDTINKTIENKEKLLAIELQKMDAEISAKAIKSKQEEIALKLAAVKKGSDEEYQLKLQKLDLARAAELAAAEKSITDKEELERRKILIAAKYDAEAERMAQENQEKLFEQEKKAMENHFAELLMDEDANNVQKARIIAEQKKYELDNLHQLEGESNEEFRARQIQAEKEYNEADKQIKEERIKNVEAVLSVSQDVMGGLSDVLDAMGEDNKAFAKASKILALAEIAINTGKAIAAGTAQAQSVPYPGNLVAIASTVATVLANVATAISTVKSAKFAKGGVDIRGAGTGTSDSIPAMISNGESVMTAKATDMFGGLLAIMNEVASQPNYTLPTTYSAADRIYNDNAQAEAMRVAMEELHPVVSVQEITKVSNRVSVIENLDTI